MNSFLLSGIANRASRQGGWKKGRPTYRTNNCSFNVKDGETQFVWKSGRKFSDSRGCQSIVRGWQPKHEKCPISNFSTIQLRRCSHRKIHIKGNRSKNPEQDNFNADFFKLTYANKFGISSNTEKASQISGKSPKNRYYSNTSNNRHSSNIETSVANGIEAGEPAPTAGQLIRHALRAAIPMIGFGFMDNTIMIHAGHYVDCTLGVTFGLSTLAAAGIGQIFSGVGGVVFGDALEVAFHRISGLGAVNRLKMTSAQKAMRITRIFGLAGGIIGMTLGCTLGLVNLLFVDAEKANQLKLLSLGAEQEFEFEVEVDNQIHPGFTSIVVRGPDIDGVLASITASLAANGCSVIELHAGLRKGDLDIDTGSTHKKDEDDNGQNTKATLPLISTLTLPDRVEDTFLVLERQTHAPIPNEDLDHLARTILAAAKDPLNSHSLKNQVEELQTENLALADRVFELEKILEDKQIKIVAGSSNSSGIIGGIDVLKVTS